MKPFLLQFELKQTIFFHPELNAVQRHKSEINDVSY